MKFKYYLERIHDAGLYPMISLVLFGSIFLLVLIYAFTADQKSMNEKANIPLN